MASDSSSNFSRTTQLLLAIASVGAWSSALPAQDTSAGSRSGVTAPQALAANRPPQYLPLESVRSGTVRMPAALTRRVTVSLEKAPLQRVLMEIATQAGLGLSYGEDLVRAAPMVSVDIKGRTAADALAAAVSGTKWVVLVTASGQVTVGPAGVPLVGIVSGLVGVTQINFTIPNGVPSGVQPVVVTVGTASSPPANINVTQ